MNKLLIILLVIGICFPVFAETEYRLEPLATGVYLFSAAFYNNIFIVSSEGVIATDPISTRVAPLLLQAIRSVTDQPVRYVIYSHDHSDHISGGAVFKNTAKFIAHENAYAAIQMRNNPAIVAPQITFRDTYDLHLGDKYVRLIYLGENHSNSNIAILLPREKILMFVDVVYPGSVPFRDLPGTNLRGMFSTLELLKNLDFTQLIYGHGRPGGKIWVAKYILYFQDMIATVRRIESQVSYPDVSTTDSEPNRRAVFDLYVERVANETTAALRGKYGSWAGYDDWAVMNAERVILYLMMEG